MAVQSIVLYMWKEPIMRKSAIAIILAISITFVGCAGMSETQQRTLSGGAIGAGAGAVVGAIAGHTALGIVAGAAAGAAGGYLYDQNQKAKQAESQKGYKAGQQSEQKTQ
jgi:osmotically inducible lipoprotein OsmB